MTSAIAVKSNESNFFSQIAAIIAVVPGLDLMAIISRKGKAED